MLSNYINSDEKNDNNNNGGSCQSESCPKKNLDDNIDKKNFFNNDDYKIDNLIYFDFSFDEFSNLLLILISSILQILAFVVVPLLLSIAFLTLLERKILASVFHGRLGPNFVGFRGILQPIADGLKLLFKEILFYL